MRGKGYERRNRKGTSLRLAVYIPAATADRGGPPSASTLSRASIKQLVVEADDKHKTVLISTIVLTDGVERVGKTGVAIELSDKGVRTGVVYMLQLRNEKSAAGLFNELLAGSDRANGR